MEIKELVNASDLIRKSIVNKQPILIRHHADCDGYSGAIALERAILKIMKDIHRKETDLLYFYKRLPSKAPYYDYSDATKDIGIFLNDIQRFDRKPPLVIVVDNGSTEQDMLALRKLRIFGASILVIDHHPPNKENDALIDVHVNSHLLNVDWSASILCMRISRLLADIEHVELLALVGAVADYCYGEEVNQLWKYATDQGYSEKDIRDIAEVVDFEAKFIGFMESRKMVDTMMFGNPEKLKRLVSIIKPEIDKRKQEQKTIIRQYMNQLDNGHFMLASIDAPMVQKNRYPSSGKLTNLLLEIIEEKKPGIALGVGKDFVCFRISSEVDLNFNQIMDNLNIPHAGISGGGHPKAGTIRFVQANNS